MGRIAAVLGMVLALALGPGAAPPAAAQEPAGQAAPARLDPARSSVRDAEGGVVIELGLSRPVPYRLFFLADPPRLVADFREVDFAAARPEALDRSAHVRALRWGPFRPGWSRLVAELDGPWRVAAAEAVTDGPAAIHLRLVPATPAVFAAAAAGPAPSALWGLPAPAPVEAPKRRQTGEEPLTVVLDPGHGGIDPGAETEGGASEAALMLTFGQELAELLRGAGMRVVMTREADVFVPLETRISVARATGADLFLSLHADALAEGEAVGATVYTLSAAASDAASARLAERHDRADLLAGVDLSGQDDEVAGVLMDLARTETQPRADRLARDLVAAIRAEGLRTHRRPLQEAEFSVLKSPDIPSVLLELGFLSSQADLERLTDPDWRARMQAAILAALTAWAAADAAEARLIRQ